MATSKTLKKAPDNDTLLALYANFKQASSGDAGGARPGVLDVVSRAKFDAWAAMKGRSRDAAMRSYIELVAGLKAAE